MIWIAVNNYYIIWKWSLRLLHLPFSLTTVGEPLPSAVIAWIPFHNDLCLFADEEDETIYPYISLNTHFFLPYHVHPTKSSPLLVKSPTSFIFWPVWGSHSSLLLN